MSVVVKVTQKKNPGVEENLFLLWSKILVAFVVVVLKFNMENQPVASQQLICLHRQIKKVSSVLSLQNCGTRWA